MEYSLHNILLALPIIPAVLFGLQRWQKKRRIQKTSSSRKSPLPWSYKVASFTLFAFCSLGYLDQFQMQCEPRNCSPIDKLFQIIPVERSYSAPLAIVEYSTGSHKPQTLNGFHLLGTDINGRDTFYLICKSAGTILQLVAGSMLISFPLGMLLGLLAGFYGGWLDDCIQWFYNTIASIPWLLFMIAFLIVFGRDLIWICVAFGLTSWIELSRLVRAETLKIKEMDFIKAAQAIGVPDYRILVRHIMPNLNHISSVHFSLTASSIVLAESVLTFIGIGVDAGTASFGSMIVDAQVELTRSPPIWWIFVGAGLFGIMPLVLSLNLLGDYYSHHRHQK